MRPLNLEEEPWQRLADYHDDVLEYSVHPPALAPDQFFQVRQRWLDQDKLLCVDHKLVLNKEKFQK